MRVLETEYAGVRFRSRLEARWAVFFDHLGIEWQYEPEGFRLEGGGYLPDFYLGGERYAEVKPPGDSFEKARAFARQSGNTVWLCEGEPGDVTALFSDGTSTAIRFGGFGAAAAREARAHRFWEPSQVEV